MPTSSAQITLLAPGCFTALAPAEEIPSRNDDAQVSPDINHAVAIATSSASYEQALAAALHQPVPPLGELPAAQFRYQFDTGEKTPEHCVCAELIHLQADKDNARLLPFAALDVSDTDSQALIESLNHLINPDGIHVERTGNGSYYLCGMPADSLDTWPAHAVANGKIANYLPRASEAGDWRRLITEVQMLFHSHPVNTRRVANSQLPINAMWFWGGAKSNEHTIQQDPLIVAEDAYVCGMASELNLPVVPLDDYQWNQIDSDVVIVDTRVYDAWLSGDHEKLIQEKNNLQTRWIKPAQQSVADGLVAEFLLDGCEGQAIVESIKLQPTGRSTKLFSPKSWFKKRGSKNKAIANPTELKK